MTGRVAALAVAGLLAAGCAPDDASTDGGPESATIRTLAPTATTTTTTASTTAAPTPPTTAPETDPVTTPTTTVVVTTTTTTTTTTAPPRVGDPAVDVVVVGTFDQPIDLAVRPGDDALWIVQQRGQIVRDDAGSRTVALDVGGLVSDANEQGLLGLAFSPDGERAVTNHTALDGATTITEWEVAPDGTFDLSSRRELLTVDQPFSNHNAGDLEFGPDGMLYIPLGDGGSGGDPQRNGHDPSTLLGSLLRIDPTPSADLPYTVPADNPFVDGPVDGIEGRPEVWAWGLRNPWKISFDPITGNLWIPDVGQNEFEEVNVVRPVGGATAGRGADFGWSAFEADRRFNDDVADRGGALTAPVLTYDHGDGCSISGGVVYRGADVPDLEPAYVYSDFCAGTLWALDLDGARNLTLVDGLDAVAAVREGPDGEIYVIQRSGDVLRVVPG